jgi:hypothetical protein
MENSFDLFGADIQEKSNAPAISKEKVNDISIACEALQIVKIVKGVMGSRREIIDTIKVDGAKMTYERALKIAKMKAERIGNCIVIEKLERIVSSY